MKEADFSLCVLQLPDILSSSNEIVIPADIQHLVMPSTYFLLNKLDMVANPLPFYSVSQQSSSEDISMVPADHIWTTSLTTGEGTHQFVHGLAEALKNQ